MNLRDAVEKRADAKVFDFKKPDWRKVVRAIDFARFAPAAGNYFSTRFILVSDEDVISRLAAASQQPFVGRAKTVVVVVSDNKGLIRAYAERGEMYSRQHVGAAIENFLLGLENEKLITSWVWYFVDEQVRRILDIPEDVSVEGIFPIGAKAKVSRIEKRSAKLDNILFFGKYGNKKMVPDVIASREVV
jgi:nitroreductase